MTVLKKTLIAAAVVTSTLVATPAFADLSANYAVSSAYMWRGQSISDPAPAVSGGIDYSDDMFYAGMWTSSEGAFDNSQETDLYVGIAGEAGDLAYDVGLITYYYPEASSSSDLLNGGLGVEVEGTGQFEEVYGSISYDMFTAGFYQGITSDVNDTYTYMYLSAGFGDFSATYGTHVDDGNGLFDHVTVDFAATDSLSFTVSVASSGDTFVEEDPLVAVTYGESFDL